MDERRSIAELPEPVNEEDTIGLRSDAPVGESQAWFRVDEPAICDENEWQRF
jgi:hypothetical protein